MGTPACTTSTTRTNRDQPRAGRERDGPKTTNKQQSLHPTTTMAIPPIKLTPSQLHLLGTFTVLLVTFREITRQPLLAMSSSTCSHYLDNHYTLIMHIDSSSCRDSLSLANVQSKRCKILLPDIHKKVTTTGRCSQMMRDDMIGGVQQDRNNMGMIMVCFR